MDDFILDILKEYIEKVNLYLKCSNWPYLFIVSDNNEIRDFLENSLKQSELIIPLKDYKLNIGSSIMNDLYKNHLLLLNIITKEKELEKSARNNEGVFAGNVLYYCLAFLREMIEETKHGLVMVCNEEIAQKILAANQTVASCSTFFFVDDGIKVKEKNKKKI